MVGPQRYLTSSNMVMCLRRGPDDGSGPGGRGRRASGERPRSGLTIGQCNVCSLLSDTELERRRRLRSSVAGFVGEGDLLKPSPDPDALQGTPLVSPAERRSRRRVSLPVAQINECAGWPPLSEDRRSRISRYPRQEPPTTTEGEGGEIDKAEGLREAEADGRRETDLLRRGSDSTDEGGVALSLLMSWLCAVAMSLTMRAAGVSSSTAALPSDKYRRKGAGNESCKSPSSGILRDWMPSLRGSVE